MKVVLQDRRQPHAVQLADSTSRSLELMYFLPDKSQLELFKLNKQWLKILILLELKLKFCLVDLFFTYSNRSHTEMKFLKRDADDKIKNRIQREFKEDF